MRLLCCIIWLDVRHNLSRITHNIICQKNGTSRGFLTNMNCQWYTAGMRYAWDSGQWGKMVDICNLYYSFQVDHTWIKFGGYQSHKAKPWQEQNRLRDELWRLEQRYKNSGFNFMYLKCIYKKSERLNENWRRTRRFKKNRQRPNSCPLAFITSSQKKFYFLLFVAVHLFAK